MTGKSFITSVVLMIAGFTLLTWVLRACQERIRSSIVSSPPGATVVFPQDEMPSRLTTPGEIDRRSPGQFSTTRIVLELDGRITEADVLTSRGGFKAGFTSFVDDIDSIDAGAWTQTEWRGGIVACFPDPDHFLVSYRLPLGRYGIEPIGIESVGVTEIDETRAHADAGILKVPRGTRARASWSTVSLDVRCDAPLHVGLSGERHGFHQADGPGLAIEWFEPPPTSASLRVGSDGPRLDLTRIGGEPIFFGESFELHVTWPDAELVATLRHQTKDVLTLRITRDPIRDE